MTAAARALGVVHNPAPRLNLPVKDDAKFVSDRIRARLYRDPRIDPTAKFVAVTIAARRRGFGSFAALAAPGVGNRGVKGPAGSSDAT